MKKWILIVRYAVSIMICLSVVNISLAQPPNFPFSASYDSAKQWALTKSKKWENFLNKNGNMYGVRWNELTGTPHSVVGPGVCLHARITPNNVSQIAKLFLLKYEDLIGIPVRDLELLKTRQRKGRWRIVFEQKYKGIPVFLSCAKLTISSSGNVVSFGADVYPDIDISVIPSLTKSSAIEIAKEDASFNPIQDVLRKSSLVVLPINTDNGLEYKLSCKIELSTENPLGKWVYFIDAVNGHILYYYDNSMHAEVYGRVIGQIYPQHETDEKIEKPFSGEFVNVEGIEGTTDEDGNYSVLVPDHGDYTVTSEFKAAHVDVDYEDGDDASYTGMVSTSSPHDISWGSEQAPALDDEMNVYYHVTRIHDYFSNDPFNCEEIDSLQLKAIVRSRDNWNNAGYDDEEKRLEFGEGDGVKKLNSALSSKPRDTFFKSLSCKA